VSIVLFYVLFVCKCVLYYCHRVTTQLQINISNHIISNHIIYYPFRGRAISSTYSESVFVALCIQHAIRIFHIVICGLSCFAVLSTLSHKRNDLQKKKKKKKDFEYKMCVSSLSTTFSYIFLILRRNERHMIKNVY